VSWLRAMWVGMVMLLSGGALAAEVPDPHREVRGITISTPTWGVEWGSPAMDDTLDAVASEGANWIAIHPYARIQGDGSVRFRPIDPSDPPAWLARPIREAHARGLKVLIKPHLAYWGSPFGWRGEIAFETAEAGDRFFRDYGAWILTLAAACREADGLVVGTELGGLVHEEARWRALIARVRDVFPGHLTWAANWDAYARVPFWDALDAVGIQAYFPVLPAGAPPTEAAVRAGWRRITDELAAVARETGKPVVLTELGYDAGEHALVRPWESGRGREDLQRLGLRIALEAIDAEPAVRGAFLWKWFPGQLQRGDYRVSRPDLRAVVREAWSR
jgi:hypothetical protein